jgi:hypothetical protein
VCLSDGIEGDDAREKYQDSAATTYEQLDRRVVELVTRMDVLEMTTTAMTMMFMHRCDNTSHVIDKVWEVMVDVVIIILNKTMIHLLRLSSLFHHSWVLMMLKLT